MAGKGFAVFRLLLVSGSCRFEAWTGQGSLKKSGGWTRNRHFSGCLKVFRLPEKPLVRRGQPEKGGGICAAWAGCALAFVERVDAVAAVHIGDFAGDAGGQIGEQEGGGGADFVGGYVAAQRVLFGNVSEQAA